MSTNSLNRPDLTLGQKLWQIQWLFVLLLWRILAGIIAPLGVLLVLLVTLFPSLLDLLRF